MTGFFIFLSFILSFPIEALAQDNHNQFRSQYFNHILERSDVSQNLKDRIQKVENYCLRNIGKYHHPNICNFRSHVESPHLDEEYKLYYKHNFNEGGDDEDNIQLNSTVICPSNSKFQKMLIKQFAIL